ncbi:MAG: hypothetical protein IH621_07320 [Krumholzibacteria bacterium]|nr:hypothetical protein [Candidatus Krumholzibacteria bacterium]
MKARRVAFMLLVLALSALTLFVIVLLDEAAQAAEIASAADARPDTLAAYSEIVSVAPGGDAVVTVTAVVGRVSSMTLLLPWGYGGGRGHRIVNGPVGFAPGADGEIAPLVAVLGVPHWNLRLLPGAAPGDTVVIEATVPGWHDEDAARRQFGAQAYASTWVNTSRFVLRDFRLGLELPAGQAVDAVDATTPSFNANRTPQPPYVIGRRGDRGTFTVGVASLPPAGRVAFALDSRPARRGPLPLALGAVVCVLYLVIFRDVLKPAARA